MSDWEQDHYQVLGVDRGATAEEIKEAYKSLQKLLHPDLLQDHPPKVIKKAEEQIKKVNEAYEVLKDPEKRREYDEKLACRMGEGTSYESGYGVPIPKPVVEPAVISLIDVKKGETRRTYFVIRNIGGEYDKISFNNPRETNPDSWVKVVNWERVDPNQDDHLPLRVYIEVKGGDWGKHYSEYIQVNLDEQETQVRIDIETRPKPIWPLSMSNVARLTLFGLVGLTIVAVLSAYFWPSTSPGLANSPWPMFQHDPQHSGRSPYSGPSSPQLKWGCSIAGGEKCVYSPAIGPDGTIYVGADDNKLYAMNPNGSGSCPPKWGDTAGGIIPSTPAISTDGTIYIGSLDYNLYAINPAGPLKWKYATGAAIRSSPAIGSDGTIYVGSSDSNLYAINRDGSLKWKYATGWAIDSSPAIAPDNTIYISSTDGKLHAINQNGSLKWSYATGGLTIGSSPAIDSHGVVYLGSGDSNLYAINRDGSLKWKYATGGWVHTPAIGADDAIYIGCTDKKLYAINSDGSLKWSFTTGAEITAAPVIGADGIIYIGSWDNNLYALNPDGSFKWSYGTRGPIRRSPAIGSNGTIYVGACDYNFYAIGGK